MKKNFLFLAACALLLTVGCEKDLSISLFETESIVDGGTISISIPYAYVLNEGVWGGNDAGISRLNLEDGTIEVDWFTQTNGRGLGDLGQDLIYYGTHLYATVFTSNTIEVINPKTGRSVKQVDMGTRGPRYMVGHGGKVYVTCYDKSVIRIDTATFDIEATCPLSGMQPEQLCVVDGKLYVCNTWEYDANSNAIYDNTISEVDLGSFTEVRKITVGTNPGRIKALPDHRFIVACSGDYYTEPATTLVVNVVDNSQITIPVAATNFDINGNDIYMYATAYDASWNPTANFYHMDANALQPTPILESVSSMLKNAYGINIDPVTGDIYICNSAYGTYADVYRFDKNGTQTLKAEAGTLASKVVF